jgi:hypothetical protein
MLQLNKSQAVNTIAIYPNEVVTSGSELLMVYTQSYSNTVTGSIQASVISNPSNTSWVIAQFSGSLLPSASGQYTFDSFELIASGSAVWNLDITQWQAASTNWESASGTLLGDLISTDRAIISGSDVTPITEYVSPNENARYIVYLG